MGEPREPSVFRRGAGLLALLVSPGVYVWGHGRPFVVPTWGVELPPVPAWLDDPLWGAFLVAAAAMVCGYRGRAAPAVALAVLGYYACRDRAAAYPSYVGLALVYLASLLFPGGAGRAIVRAAVSACYLATAAHKAVAWDWIGGGTLADMARYGTHVRPAWWPLLRGLPDWAFPALAAAVVAGEAAVGAGLWHPRTRRRAMIAGLGLHASILLLVSGVDLFAPAMLVGYLAFAGADPPAPKRARAAAVALAVLVAAFPLRQYLGLNGWRVAPTFADTPVWSFSMFLSMQEVTGAAAEFRTADGQWHPFALTGRGAGGGSGPELRALARHVLRATPGATAARVRCAVVVNHRRTVPKSFTLLRARK